MFLVQRISELCCASWRDAVASVKAGKALNRTHVRSRLLLPNNTFQMLAMKTRGIGWNRFQSWLPLPRPSSAPPMTLKSPAWHPRAWSRRVPVCPHARALAFTPRRRMHVVLMDSIWKYVLFLHLMLNKTTFVLCLAQFAGPARNTFGEAPCVCDDWLRLPLSARHQLDLDEANAKIAINLDRQPNYNMPDGAPETGPASCMQAWGRVEYASQALSNSCAGMSSASGAFRQVVVFNCANPSGPRQMPYPWRGCAGLNRCAILYCIILDYTILYYTTWHAMSYYTILYYSIVYYTTLYYTMAYYTIL